MSAIKCLQLCQSFREQAEWVANKLSRADHLRMAYSEETITENVLLALAERHSGRDLVIRAYTKREEGTGTRKTNGLPTGADWSFWFADGNNRGIELRIQAKRLFASGEYESLDGRGGKGTQIDLLEKNRGNAIPLYVFYNFDDLFIHKTASRNQCNGWNFFRSGEFGCTYAPLTSIPKKNKPTYCDIPVMLPWHTLVCDCFCSQLPVKNPKNLPQRIAASVEYAYSEMGIIELQESKESEQKLHFNTLEQSLNFNAEGHPPEWVGLLLNIIKEKASTDGADDPLASKLDNYLNKSGLRGVAFIREKPKPED